MQKLDTTGLKRKSVDEFKVATKIPIVVVLDNVRSMHNVGSVFRTADAFLLQGIFLCGYTPRPPHRDIHKTALGATETVDWKYFDKCAEAVQWLKNEGFRIIAVEQVKNSKALNNFSANAGEKSKLAVVFGNEVNGIDEEILTMSDNCVEIPQLGMKHSLNIAVAAGIVLWEFVRTRLCDFKQDN